MTIDSSVGIDEQNQSFFVYPNPTNDKLNITAPKLIGKRGKIMHTSGKLVFEFIQATEQVEINCTHLAPGEYIISFEGVKEGTKSTFIKN